MQPAGYGTAGGRTARSARGGRRRSNWRKCAGRGGKQHWRGTATLDTAAGTLVLENVTLDGSLSIRPASAFTVTVLGAVSYTHLILAQKLDAFAHRRIGQKYVQYFFGNTRMWAGAVNACKRHGQFGRQTFSGRIIQHGIPQLADQHINCLLYTSVRC